MLTPQIYKKKIGSMKIIQKISSIMKSSAYIKINKLSKIINDSKQNCSNIYQLVAKLLNYSEVRNRFFTQGLSTKTLWIAIGSEIGMCGSFNFITAKKIMDNSKANDEIIIFNKKIIPYFTKNKNAKIIKMLNTTTIPIHEIEILSSFLYSSYVADKYMSIKIVYSDVASNHSVNHKILEILPMDKSFLDLKVSSSNILFNDDKNDIAKIAFELYLNTIIISAIKDSIQAENIIRFNSMDMAQKNLKEIINDLEFNLLKAKEKRSNSDQISTFTSVEN